MNDYPCFQNATLLTAQRVLFAPRELQHRINTVYLSGINDWKYTGGVNRGGDKCCTTFSYCCTKCNCTAAHSVDTCRSEVSGNDLLYQEWLYVSEVNPGLWTRRESRLRRSRSEARVLQKPIRSNLLAGKHRILFSSSGDKRVFLPGVKPEREPLASRHINADCFGTCWLTIKTKPIFLQVIIWLWNREQRQRVRI